MENWTDPASIDDVETSRLGVSSWETYESVRTRGSICNTDGIYFRNDTTKRLISMECLHLTCRPTMKGCLFVLERDAIGSRASLETKLEIKYRDKTRL